MQLSVHFSVPPCLLVLLGGQNAQVSEACRHQPEQGGPQLPPREHQVLGDRDQVYTGFIEIRR